MAENSTPFPYAIDTAGVHKTILDNNELIDELILTLQGSIVDTIEGKIKKVGKSMVSNDTLSWMIGRLLPYTSKIFILSYLSSDLIRQMKYEFSSNVAVDLISPEVLGIDRKDREFIKDLMSHTFEATIHKAEKGETLTKLMAQHSITEQIMHEEKRKKGGFSSVIPDIFKGKRSDE